MDNTTNEHLVVGHLCQVVDALHIITGPNGMCMCGTDGMTCGQILAMHSKEIQDARIMSEMKERVGAKWVGADAVESDGASKNAERVRCSALLGELEAVLGNCFQAELDLQSGHTTFATTTLKSAIRGLRKLIASERRHSPNIVLGDVSKI